MKTLVWLCLMLPASMLGGDDFKDILRRAENYYGRSHMKIPFLGMVTFASHLTRPLGASDLRIAIIDGVGSRSGVPDFHPGPEWRAFLRTTSRNGEHTVMYGREEGHAVRTLMVVLDKDEAVVMQMRLDPGRFAKFVAEKSR